MWADCATEGSGSPEWQPAVILTSSAAWELSSPQSLTPGPAQSFPLCSVMTSLHEVPSPASWLRLVWGDVTHPLLVSGF